MNDILETKYGKMDAVYDHELEVWRIYLMPDLSKELAEDKLWLEFKKFADEKGLEHTIKIQRKHPNYVVAWVKNKKMKEEAESVYNKRQ